MKTLEQHPETIARVRFGDCDPFNHLNNARYLDYFLNAREDHLLHNYGLSTMQILKETGRTWVVTENRIAYLRPAHITEELAIQSTVLKVADKRLLIEMRMFDKEKTHLKSLLWVTLAHFDMKTQRSIAHEGEMADLLKGLERPLPEGTTFEQRVQQVKEETKERAAALSA